MPTIFRSKRSDLVEQKLYCILTAYNMIRSLIKEAADTEGGDPLSVSFLETVDIIIECAALMSLSAEKRKKKERIFLLQMIANSKTDRPQRPRRNPRVVKVKMSNFKRKHSTDKSERTDFMKDVEILYQDQEAA